MGPGTLARYLQINAGHPAGFLWLLVVVGLFGSNAALGQEGYRDITDRFSILHSPPDAYSPHEFFAKAPPLELDPLIPPRNVNADGQAAWLKAELPATGHGAGFQVLEIPGQIFNYIDVWFQLPDGSLEHHVAGDRYPYTARSVRHASFAFPIPQSVSQPIPVLIRMRNEATHAINFSAWVWKEAPWSQYLMAERLWYGTVLGAILALVIYNLFLASSLRDMSYLYYVGYMLSVFASVVVLSGLPEEYFWPEGKPRPLISAFNGMATLFLLAFVNRFLGMRSVMPSVYLVSSVVGVTAFLCGLYLAFSDSLPLIPAELSAGVVKLLSLIAMLYFVIVSVVSYMRGFKQARFLSLGMLTFLGCLVVYFCYTHALIGYNPIVAHLMEFGAVSEAVLLSLALSDRIRILNETKRAAESAALELERTFSMKLLELQEKNRQSVADALHDSIGHAILVMKNNLLDLGGPDTGRPSLNKVTGYQEIVSQCDEIMRDVRRLSHDLHPHILQRLGLEAALESTFERALDPAGIEWSLKISGIEENPIEDRLAITVYRVVQEALSNILKYSGATSVSCDISADRHNLVCDIVDNGVGFDPDKLHGDSLGIEESAGRIRLLGGEFILQSRPDNGTETRFSIPVTLHRAAMGLE